MTNAHSTAAESVSRNVWVLGQLRGYSSKQEMANAMEWDRSRFSRTLSGERQWTLEDLVTAADVLGLAGPGELFRPLAELVNSVHPAATGTADRTGVRLTCLRPNTAAVIPFPQVTGPDRRHARRQVARSTRVNTPRRTQHLRVITPLTAISVEPVTAVTAAVGL